MTSYVTREEYERLSARLAKLEAGEIKVTGYVLSVDGDVDRLNHQKIRAGIASYGRSFEQSLARRA